MGRKLEGLQRMLVIINKLKGQQQYVSREKLKRYVSLRMEEREGTPVDLRTLQRDFNEIDSLFGIHIHFNKKRNGYCINEEDKLKREQYERLLLNFDILNAIFYEVWIGHRVNWVTTRRKQHNPKDYHQSNR